MISRKRLKALKESLTRIRFKELEKKHEEELIHAWGMLAIKLAVIIFFLGLWMAFILH